MKWLLQQLITIYVWIVYGIETFWLWYRCSMGRPVVYKDWPNKGHCKRCGKPWKTHKLGVGV